MSSGCEFNFLEPETSKFKLLDIASALSKICRFTGHTRQFYSVAQHSVMCSHLVPKEDRLAALMHDAAEAFIGDVSTPLKQLLPDYKAIEARVEAVVFARFGLPAELPSSVKAADLRMLATEAKKFMPREAMNWDILAFVELVPVNLVPWSPAQAQAEFLDRYQEITGLNPYL
jgi:hypothetical protein